MKAIFARLGDLVDGIGRLLAAVGDRVISEPVLDIALVNDVLIILAAVRTHQPISDAIILDVVQTVLALFARSKVTPVANLPAAGGSIPDSGIKPAP